MPGMPLWLHVWTVHGIDCNLSNLKLTSSSNENWPTIHVAVGGYGCWRHPEALILPVRIAWPRAGILGADPSGGNELKMHVILIGGLRDTSLHRRIETYPSWS